MANLQPTNANGAPISGGRAALWATALGIVLVSCALLFELAGVAFYARQEGGLFYTAERQEPGEPPGHRLDPTTVFHPYYGFSIRPDTPFSRFWQPKQARAFLEGMADRSRQPAWTQLHANNFGFYANRDYPMNEPETLLVGIFGGSVAHSFALQGSERLVSKLETLLVLAGRPIRILNFASGGYKQPQQLLILAYLLHLGQRLDFVVNLDGFNEVALGGLNMQTGLDSSMPSAVHLRSLRVLASPPSDLEAIRYRVALDDLEVRDRALRQKQSETSSAGLWMLAEWKRRKAMQERRRLAAAPPEIGESSPLVAILPPLDGDPATEPTQRIAADWERASRLMSAMAAEAGARYLHVLQPNQYVGDRVFSPLERRRTIHPRSPYAPLCRTGYPALKQAGARLVDSGISFRDATAVFDSVAEPVYADDCCHYNQRGNDILADFIFEAMAEILEHAPAATAKSPDTTPSP